MKFKPGIRTTEELWEILECIVLTIPEHRTDRDYKKFTAIKQYLELSNHEIWQKTGMLL